MTPEQALYLAETYVRLDRGERALEFAASARDDDPRTWLWRGWALALLGRHEEADAAVRRGLALAPEDATLHRLRGYVALMQLRMDEAEDAAREAIRLDPENAEYRSFLALLFGSTRRKDAAATLMAQAHALAPAEPNVLYMGAFIAMQRNDPKEAERLSLQLLTEAPEFAGAHWVRGLVLVVNNAPRKALVHFREAVRLQPGNATFVRSARRTGHPLLALWRLTAPAGQSAAIAIAFIAFHTGWWDLFAFGLLLFIYMFVAPLSVMPSKKG